MKLFPLSRSLDFMKIPRFSQKQTSEIGLAGRKSSSYKRNKDRYGISEFWNVGDMPACICVCMCAHMHIYCTYRHLQGRTCMWRYMRICIQTCLHIYVSIDIYIYIYIYIYVDVCLLNMKLSMFVIFFCIYILCTHIYVYIHIYM